MLIIGGIYFELQSPGIGFPLIAAATAALLYFAPLYLEGLLQNWELLVFVLGVLLLLLEIFVIPGFGITGISGILLCVTGLIFAMVDNTRLHTPEGFNTGALVRPMATLSIAVFCGLTGAIYLTRRLYSTRMFGRIALRTGLSGHEGYVGVDTAPGLTVGSEGSAQTALRPSGKVEINGEIYDAVAEYGMIGKGDAVRVTRYETGQIYCVKKQL
jgi:membrane-bound serine protease (ClpP class)